MKPTTIKISISQDGLLPHQSIQLGEMPLQNFPKKLMSALDFEKVDGDRKKTTFLGIMPVFVVIGEKTQEIEIELTVAHPELRDKVVDIFTSKPHIEVAEKTKPATKRKPAPKKPAASKNSKSPEKKNSVPSSVSKKPVAKSSAPKVKRASKPQKKAPTAVAKGKVLKGGKKR